MTELFFSLIEYENYIFGKLKNYIALGPSYILSKIKSKDKARST